VTNKPKDKGQREARVLCWVSCGAASAVAAKLAIEKYGIDRVIPVYCDVMFDEHPDNRRFFSDIENWLGKDITVLRSKEFTRITEVFAKSNWMSGIKGAKCTVEMKKVPRHEFERPDDIHVFGFTADEFRRIDRFKENNPELICDWILRDQFVTKVHCLEAIREAHIVLPKMYGLGFNNNNCIGCVKATSPEYWRKVKHFFPHIFRVRAEQSREIGARLVRVDGVRMFLDEMPPGEHLAIVTEDLFCGPDCMPTEAKS